jgi:hypothetical protein
LVVTLSEAAGIDPFVVMALINTQALIALCVAVFLLSSLYKSRFAYNWSAVVTFLLGINALFWLFLPLKLARAFFGEVRGTEDVARLLSLRPFNLDTIRQFLSVYFNQTFLLDKFMVATAMSLGLALMATLWYGSGRYLAQKDKYSLALACISCLGVIAFHPIVGLMSLGAILGGLILLEIFRNRVADYDRQVAMRLAAGLILASVVISPYLYSVTHAKDSEQLFPLAISVTKMVGMVISCSLGILLAAFQVRKLMKATSVQSRFLIFAAAAIIVIAVFIALPGTTLYRKPPILAFFPLAVVGGWTFVDLAERAGSATRRRLWLITMLVLAFAPQHFLALGAYYNTRPAAVLTADERTMAEWVRVNTTRASLMFESNDRVLLLVAGPRRYYWGRSEYANLSGFDQGEMTKRRRIRDDLYTDSEIEQATLQTLGGMAEDVFVIVRTDEDVAGVVKLARYPELFRNVFSVGSLAVFEVDRAACRAIR